MSKVPGATDSSAAAAAVKSPPPQASPRKKAAAVSRNPFCLPFASKQSPDATLSPHGSNKKRPYRRTKRPKHYNDKSTITTTTEAARQQNVYDAILAESEDLWRAAAEAQQLGRNSETYSYLWLLHSRLVFLGKRFDACRRRRPAAIARPATADVEQDTALMEHLAQAASEMLAQQMGKKFVAARPEPQQQKQQPQQQVQLVADQATPRSPAVDAKTFWASTANSRGLTTASHHGTPSPKTASVQEQQQEGPHRGKKPATVAMNTLPNANCDIRSLLAGADFTLNPTQAAAGVEQEEEQKVDSV